MSLFIDFARFNCIGVVVRSMPSRVPVDSMSPEGALDALKEEVEHLEKRTEHPSTLRESVGRTARNAKYYEERFNELHETIPFSDEHDELLREVAEWAGKCESVRLELEDLTAAATEQGEVGLRKNECEYDINLGLHGELYCDEFTMAESLACVFEQLPKDLVERFDVTIGFQKSPRTCLTETAKTNAFERRVFFSFDIDTEEYSYTAWNRDARVLGVQVNRGGSIECWGPFADPLKTKDSREMARHIEKQLPAVERRLGGLLELERVSGQHLMGDTSEPSYTDLSEHHSAVIRAGGIGETGEERLAEIYGSPSNIVPYGVEGVYKGASTAYGNEPNAERAYWQCVEATRRFRKFKDSGDIDCDCTLEELFKYPKYPVHIKHSYCTPHTEN